ncbi:MAG: hypothetical protein AUK31_09305 [Fibrobacteres bacterium CG2_30_45_31]|nr:MAG: hypothetical protein AUK31_09305 [Fibrobacteres bacterium CG2_30_45_31]
MKQRFKLSFLAFSLILFGTQTFAAPDPNFHVYIAFGQSNMQGNATVTDENRKTNDRFKILAPMTCTNMGRTLGEWAVAVPPMFHCYTGLSPADYFGKTMADSLPGVTIGIIPVAVAGTAIRLFDEDQYKGYLDSAAQWLKDLTADYGGNPYGRMIELAKKAQEVGVIKGILLHQGETDAYSDTWANSVKKIYNKMLSDLGLAADSVPLLAGEVLSPGKCSGANTQIDALPSKIPTAHVVSSSGLVSGGDSLHFSNESYQEFGKRYAQVMLSLLKIVPVDQAPYQDTIAIPGTVEAENYDVGGQNVSYSDNETANQGNVYRTDGVDIVTISSGYAVGYTNAGEWLEYTVKIAKEDFYTYEALVASGSDASSFRLFIDNQAITDTIKVANGGDWDTYSTVTGKTTALTAGPHILKIAITGNYTNIDNIKFTESTTHITEVNANLVQGPQTFKVYNIKGTYLGAFHATDISTLKVELGKSKLNSGIYLVQNKNISKFIEVKK